MIHSEAELAARRADYNQALTDYEKAVARGQKAQAVQNLDWAITMCDDRYALVELGGRLKVALEELRREESPIFAWVLRRMEL